ncbi:MAG: gamma-glutamylcyclotransferase [Hyphomicrobiales bacterium]|nr:gamma-glutamylcyclotransferase [Hyphomicrobiales bacterium]
MLFAYGSLIDDRVWSLVAGPGAGPAAPAVLEGFRRVCVAGAWFPTVAAAPGHRVAGVVRRAVPAAALRRLVAFEGAEYEIRELAVTLDGGATAAARVFVTRPAVRLAKRGGDWVDWSYDDWCRRGRGELIRRLSRGGGRGD